MYLSFRSSTLKFENDTSRIPKIPFWVGSHGSFKCVFVTRSVVEQFSRSVTSGTVQNCFLLVGTTQNRFLLAYARYGTSHSHFLLAIRIEGIVWN